MLQYASTELPSRRSIVMEGMMQVGGRSPLLGPFPELIIFVLDHYDEMRALSKLKDLPISVKLHMG